MYLPETMGAGCAFLDYNGDGWMDILLVNGMDWPAHKKQRTTPKLYRNKGGGAFVDVTHASGLDVEIYGMGAAIGDYDNDGLPDIFISAVGQNRLFRNKGDGRFEDVTRAAGLIGRESFSAAALWFDYDSDGRLDLFVANYVRWTPESDIFCTIDGRRKSYCTPEAYRGETSWLFRNKGDGTFEDVTVKANLFDSTSKALGAALLDFDADGLIDLFVANDTQPNKLYRNLGKGRFQEVAVASGIAFSEDGKARAGMGTDAADFDLSGAPSVAVTNFNNEMLAFFRNTGDGSFKDIAPTTALGPITRGSLGFGCLFLDVDLDGWPDLLVANGHIDEVQGAHHGDSGRAQSPHLVWNRGGRSFLDIAAEAGRAFVAPKVGRGVAVADIDLDGDLDILITENGGPAHLFRNDLQSDNRGIRFELRGTVSNRDAIGALVRVEVGGRKLSQLVKTGSSYLSQSELPLTFGLGHNNRADRVTIRWPSGRVEEFSNLAAGQTYRCVEGAGIRERIPLASRPRPASTNGPR
ncbi:MAG: CRTAC1 family protein [Bryobacteraceae bacterium]|nr:CRTAC1 family protein [Bryobacteraceae bacterium]